MAATQHLHYASNHQPALPIATLLRDPRALDLLRQLAHGALPRAELAPTPAERALLRRLQQVNLVLAYTIAGVTKYRAHRFPPAVRRALAA